MILSIQEFIGHFHPSLVHLPVGILLTGLFLQALSVREKNKQFRAVLPLIYGAGFMTALASCFSGYLLSLGDEYEIGTLTFHMWMAIGTTGVAALLFYLVWKKRFDTTTRTVSFLLLAGIVITGHLGGTLTHGSGYLSLSVLNTKEGAAFRRAPVPDVQQALLFSDLVQPVLHEKCFSCHGPSKRKGGLRMDDTTAFLKGGKNGKVLNPENAETSELWKRLKLPADDDDHMPPSQKPQLSENEMALLHWWLQQGAEFEGKVNAFPQDPRIKSMLVSFEKVDDRPLYNTDIPETPVVKADEKVIRKLAGAGFTIIPVAQNSNYLEVTFPGDREVTDELLNTIPLIKKQLVSLKAGGTGLNDEGLQKITDCKNILRLELQHTRITDKGVALLRNLPVLRYLNLVGTEVTASGVSLLKGQDSLKRIYLYQTKVDKKKWVSLQQAFPETTLDSGGYIVPLLPADTTVLEKPVYTP